MKKYYGIMLNFLQEWSQQKILNLFIFNAVLTMLLLLRSAGYFAPYLPLTINLITLLCFIMAVFLLGFRFRALFVITLLFWLFAAFLKIIGINIWAERAAIYSFEAFAIGFILFVAAKNNVQSAE